MIPPVDPAAPSIGWQAGEWASLLFERRSQRGGLADAMQNTFAALLDTDDALDTDANAGAVRDLARGGYAMLYGDAPKADVGPAWARALAEAIGGLDGLAEARAAVAGDPDMTAIATAAMMNAAASKVPAVVDAIRDAGLDPVTGQPSSGEGTLDADEQAAFLSEIGRSVGLGAVVAQALDEVAEGRDLLNGILPGLGTAPPRSEQENSGRLALIERVRADGRFRKVLQVAGRMQRIAERVRMQRTDDVPEEVVDVERGGDLGRLLPSELVGLKHPVLRRLTLKGLAERSLLQYKLTGTERLGRGPIAVLLDVSDSMARPLSDGLRCIDWAAAVGVAAIRSAVLQRRAVSLCTFNDDVVRTWAVPAGDSKAAAAAVLDVARIGVNGGTRFDPAIRWALDAGAEKDRADLVLVTDGEGDVGPAVAARLADAKTRGLRLWGVLAGEGGLAESLRQYADDVAVLDGGTDAALAVGSMGAV